MPKLTDSSRMPQGGKHHGDRMIDIPSSYLLWLYENDRATKDVREYIEENLEVIKSQANG